MVRQILPTNTIKGQHQVVQPNILLEILNEPHVNVPVCQARYYHRECGVVGDYLCLKHKKVYEKHKKLRNGWIDCFGPELCCDVSGFTMKHKEWTKEREYYNRENADMRNEECKRKYPLE